MIGLIMFIALASQRIHDGDTSPILIKDYIAAEATLNGVDVAMALHVANAESQYGTLAVGDSGTSYGLFQIHLPAHKEVSKEQALDPVFATEWSMVEMKQNGCKIWSTCPNQ